MIYLLKQEGILVEFQPPALRQSIFHSEQVWEGGSLQREVKVEQV